MTDDPSDSAYRQAAAAYRSAGNLRKPSPAPQIVRLVEQPGPLPAFQAAPPPPNPPAAQDSGRLAGEAPGVSAPASAGVPGAPPARGVSLMITNAQKDSLRHLGVTEDELRDMTPSEAHRRLGLSGR